MNRNKLIELLVIRKMKAGGNRKPLCICMAGVANTAQQRPAAVGATK